MAQVCLILQCLAVALACSPTGRQDQAVIAGVCSTLVYGANAGYDLEESSTRRVYLIFLVAHCGLMLISILICSSIPRGPQLFLSQDPEKPVDRERTVSVLSRYTLSWANPLLSDAMRDGGLELHSLPYLRVCMTVRALVLNFNSFQSPRLWKHIIRAHASAFTTQWILTVFWAIATLAPQYCLYKLIGTLENEFEHPKFNASLWLVLLGLSQFAQPWAEAWMLWIGWCHIALPIYVQFSGLIVEKSMRKKDIKGINAGDRASEPNCIQTGNKDEEIAVPKGTQDRINLITVDAQRLTDFLSYNSQFVPSLPVEAAEWY